MNPLPSAPSFRARAVRAPWLGALLAAAALTVQAQVAMPYYTAEQALQGLYGRHEQPRAQAFQAEATRLVQTAQAHCAQSAPLSALRTQWQQTLLAWQALATPAIGPVVARRSQRQIDFWPPRPALLKKALDRAPQSLADLERIGSPAKGFPALEQLLWATPPDAPLPAATCAYATLVAQGIEAEAAALQTAFEARADKDWSDSAEDTGAAFAEWINQWLGGLERLRWAYIEKPLRSANGRAPAFARSTREADVADWQAQWQSLRAQARLAPGQYATPPAPGEALVPIEALLMGKGQLALAQRWAQALDKVDAGFAALSPQTPPQALLALAQQMKAVTVLYQNEVAGALDVPLGFSDADGD